MANDINTDIPMPELDSEMGRAILQLSTDKADRGVYSCAAIHYINTEGNVTFDVFGDFRIYLQQDKTARATAKAMQEMHAHNFTPEKIELIKARALHFYATRSR